MALQLTDAQIQLLANITSDDIARWNAAAQNQHWHSNKKTLDSIIATDIGTTDNVQNGTADNQFAVWDNTTGKYIPTTSAAVMELLGFKIGTSAERNAYTPATVGFLWLDTTDTSLYLWDGSNWH